MVCRVILQTCGHILGAGPSRSHSVDTLEFLHSARLSKVSQISFCFHYYYYYYYVSLLTPVCFRNAETWLGEQRRRLRWLRAKSIELGIYKPQRNVLDKKFFATRPSKKPKVGTKSKVGISKIDWWSTLVNTFCLLTNGSQRILNGPKSVSQPFSQH